MDVHVLGHRSPADDLVNRRERRHEEKQGEAKLDRDEGQQEQASRGDRRNHLDDLINLVTDARADIDDFEQGPREHSSDNGDRPERRRDRKRVKPEPEKETVRNHRPGRMKQCAPVGRSRVLEKDDAPGRAGGKGPTREEPEGRQHNEKPAYGNHIGLQADSREPQNGNGNERGDRGIATCLQMGELGQENAPKGEQQDRTEPRQEPCREEQGLRVGEKNSYLRGGKEDRRSNRDGLDRLPFRKPFRRWRDDDRGKRLPEEERRHEKGPGGMRNARPRGDGARHDEVEPGQVESEPYDTEDVRRAREKATTLFKVG
mgnify:CR=1 FL=1